MKEYKNEKEFLKDYNPDEYEKPSITTDILLVSVSSKEQTNYRKRSPRDSYPFKDKWSLPGGFLNIKTETLDECAKRVLKTETNISDVYLEQLYTYSSLDRDPRMRVISTSYIALIDKNKLTENLNENVSWFDVSLLIETKNQTDIILDNGLETISFSIKKTLKEKTTDRYKFSIIKNDSIAFDHPLVILAGLERLKNKANYTDIVFNMMPEYFTLKELQQVYEIILNKKLLDPAFRRIIANKVQKTKKVQTGAGHRPSALFSYKNHD